MFDEEENLKRFVSQPGEMQFLDENGKPVPLENLEEYIKNRHDKFMEKYKNYLDKPKVVFLDIGRIVKIQECQNPILILAVFYQNNGKMSDYAGYELINGNPNQEKLYTFDHNQIVEVYPESDLDDDKKKLK